MTQSIELESFGAGLEVALFGATGGLGRAFAAHLSACPAVSRIFAFSRRGDAPAGPKTVCRPFDLSDEDSIRAAAAAVRDQADSLHLVIVASGILQEGDEIKPEKSWRALDAKTMEQVFRINTIGPALVAKHFLPLLARERKAAFAAISARVGSIEDNALGGWHSYRASKAALNMLLKTFAIELARKHPLAFCVGLHPGTVDTGLSKPFQGGVPDHKLFSPSQSAGYLLGVLEGLEGGDSGKVFAWDGRPVPA